MKKLNYQTIDDVSGNALFAILPMDVFEQLKSFAGDKLIFEKKIAKTAKTAKTANVPHGVVKIMIEKDVSLLAAWRLYRNKSQPEVAAALGVTQSSVSQIEKGKPQKATREKLAVLYECDPEQLVE